MKTIKHISLLNFNSILHLLASNNKKNITSNAAEMFLITFRFVQKVLPKKYISFQPMLKVTK
jgi:hypothetical protein